MVLNFYGQIFNQWKIINIYFKFWNVFEKRQKLNCFNSWIDPIFLFKLKLLKENYALKLIKKKSKNLTAFYCCCCCSSKI